VGKRQYNRHILPKLADNSFGELEKVYKFKLESEDRVAGNRTQRILIQPKDKLRYGYRLWLGEDNHLLLKSDLINTNGKILEQAMFADINVVNQIPDEMLKPSSSGKGFSRIEQHKKTDGDQKVISSEWMIKELPKGFSISSHIRQTLPNSEHPAEHWIATDGLASVSVYLEKVSDKKHTFEGLTHAGAMNVYGLLLDGYHVTVVGEVPANTVEMIARSVVMNPAGQ
jgi:sigma-E factor negative regulatory protein RseB